MKSTIVYRKGVGIVNSNPYAQYKQNAMETKSPGELTLMLYEGCLKFMKRAETALAENEVEEKHTNLVKAQNIIRELMVTLNTDVQVSSDMMQLYDYILNQLIEANTKNDVEALKRAERFTIDFRDTWKEVVQADRRQRFGTKERTEAPAAPQAGSTNGQAVGRIQPEKKAVPASETSQPAASAAPSKAQPANPYAKARQQAVAAGAPSNPYAKAKQQAAVAAGTSNWN
ncbi:Flagellar export chaperone FliS [Alkalicoccus chagannorensis]